MKRRKIAAVLLSFCLMAGLSGCGMSAKDEGIFVPGVSGGGTKINTEEMPKDMIETSESKEVPGFESAVMGSDGESGEEEIGASKEAEDKVMDFVPEPAEEDIDVAPEIATDEPVPPQAGLLTAGEWRDNENWGFFTNLVHTGRFTFRQFGIAPYQRVVVQAFSEGMPARKVKVRLCTASGSAISCAVTDHNGRAYLYYNIYGGQERADHVVLVKPDGSEVQVNLIDVGQEANQNGTTRDGKIENQTELEKERETENQASGQGQLSPYFQEYITSAELTVELGTLEEQVQALDLMFVFDTTGSMGDELMYLQKEFENIAERVADQSTRFSVNFYRDKGDAYVVRANPFSSDIKAIATLINAESADGGGDYEEAVDEALIDAVVKHDWRENAVKLMFLILDAPPHDTAETAVNIRTAVDAAMEQGIRIIPIASSGVNEMTEAFLRSLAMLTGGTYTFLTDDSGIGNSHLEPTIGAYTVEALNEMIVRLVREYYGE